MTGERLVIVGGGGFARELMVWAVACTAAGTLPPVGGYLDDAGPVLAPLGYDLPYLGSTQDYGPQVGDRFVLALGDPAHKRAAFGRLDARGAVFPRFIHPSAHVAPTATIGEGVIMLLSAVAGPETRISRFVTINGGSGVGHDGTVGEFTTISSHVDVTGGATIGADVFVGSKALFMPRVRIGDGARIGAGSICYRSVPAGGTVFAQPAKLLRSKKLSPTPEV